MITNIPIPEFQHPTTQKLKVFQITGQDAKEVLLLIRKSVNQTTALSSLAHSVRSNVLSIIYSLKIVEERIIEQDYDGALSTIKLISEYAPDIANTMKDLEQHLLKLE